MGAVYLAADPLIERMVAIKVLRVEQDEANERFLREAKAAGRLNHPNIVTIYDTGVHDGLPFIAMEHVVGATLGQVLRAKEPLPLVRKLEIVEAICAGLEYAHRSGLVHRDIKPGNVMVGANGEVKILDFGIARISNANDTKAGMVIGTPNYMAPEQVTGERATFAADIFGVGALLFEVLTLRRPFDADSISSVFYKLLHEDPPPVSSIAGDVPPGLDGVVARALAKKPADRYASMRQMGFAIGNVRRQLTLNRAEVVDAVRATDAHVSLEDIRDTFERGDLDSAVELVEAALADRPDDLGVSSAAAAIYAALAARESERASTAQSAASPATKGAPATPERLVPSDDEPTGAWLRKPTANARSGSSMDGLNDAPLPMVESKTSDAELSASPDPGDQTVYAPSVAPSPLPPPATTPPDRGDHTMVLAGPALGEADADLSDARLVVTESADPRRVGRSVRLWGRSVVLGRSDEWLQIAEASWSRRHAEIVSTERGFAIRDLGSANGTRVNGYLIANTAEPMLFGAKIGIGSTVLTFSHVQEMRIPDLTGVEIDGRYVLEELLRDGAKAALYSAQDRRLKGRVAIKILSPELAKYPGYTHRFRREAELARQLHHPHVCQVLDYGNADLPVGDSTQRTHYLCLELMEGGNLFDRIERRERFDWRTVAHWVERLAAALSLAHRRGLVHRDIKPTAVVFDSDNNPYLTDFAIADQGDADQQHMLGTPAYMAPELWEGGKPTPAADQFGLAVVAYYLITGSRPFEGQEQPEIRRRNFLQGPLPAHLEAEHNGRPGLLRGVSAVLAKALATAPAERFESVEAFAAALSASLVRPARPVDAAQLFFSYQRESTSGWVNYFADRLRGAGLSVFVDTHNRDSNGVFPEQVARTIEDCSVFVCFLGERTLESRWVRDEINLAHQYGKAMIPVFQEGYARPRDASTSRGIERLLTSQGIHLHDRRNLNPEQSASDLAGLARRYLEQRPNA